MRTLVAILAISLSACVTKPVTPIKIDTPVNIDQRALMPCSDLVVPALPLTFDSLLASAVSNAELYLDCRNKQDLSIKLLKQFANKKETP